MTNSADPIFTPDDIAPRLVAEFGYSPTSAQRVAERLATIDEDIRRAFWRWWQTGEFPASLEVQGYTLERLMRDHDLGPVAAFSTLDGLKVDPELTLDTLRRGFDRHPTPPGRSSVED